ncbi:tetratricopeptide repeat protein [Winogradskyella sediminis]|uniref:tetratricopeptide repeat protein n=1 Tax=Winogradskyella sediminis TaxID=1382466 RepID=UPI000E25EA08|nr:tetratricopeptide repeat protein [Winogradskyella sediminis]REG86022.1 tetratricopeptide repeat protein [Winogradskyella sediminis]
MKKILFTITICLFHFSYYAQDQLATELEVALNEEQYDKIIGEHADKANDYSAKAIYYIGMAYYMKADDDNVLKLMDLSIQKDSTDPDAYFIKGMTYNYMGQFDNAISSFNKAIALNSNDSNYYSGLGDAFISQDKLDQALSAYTTATEKHKPIERPFTMIPQIYAELNQPDKALDAFYKSKDMISIESDSYIIALYNIGLYEFLKKEYTKSEIAYKELLERVPNDYGSYAKLIQVYYGQKEYDKAVPLKEKLYIAYNEGKLKDSLKTQFCFDQFEWNGKLIFVYERFEENEGELYYKHIFYVTNDKGETEFTIQTENSPISIELGGSKYVLGMDKNGTHSTFRYGFEEDFDYDDLKKTVILVLEEKIKAGASSRKSKN